jgi:3-oxoadipate CoA-transferase, beta subunit
MDIKTPKGWSREQMAQNIARDIPDGSYVNLGIGMPELVANYIPDDREVVFHTENGLLGVGPSPPAGSEDDEMINAGKKPVTANKGASFFHHADSFSMIRGGHIDICVLGAFQISESGDLANWSTGEPGAIPAVGGAMDLVQGVKNVIIITKHITKTGEPKIVNNCTYPLTGTGVVDKIYTDFAIIDVTTKGLFVREMAPGISLEYLQQCTQSKLHTY